VRTSSLPLAPEMASASHAAARSAQGELVRHLEQFGSELNHVQVAVAEQSAIARMAPQVLGSVPSLRTQQGRCEKMNDELCGA
jgi:hypothetical protein